MHKFHILLLFFDAAGVLYGLSFLENSDEWRLLGCKVDTPNFPGFYASRIVAQKKNITK